MTSRTRLAAGAFMVSALVAACGGSTATPTPVPVPAATREPTRVPSPVPSPATAPLPTPVGSLVVASPTASQDGLHADLHLESMLPTAVAGEPVRVETVPLRDYLALVDPTTDAAHQLRRFLTEVGSDPDVIALAFGSYGAADTEQVFQAYRAPGARPDRLLAATVYLMRGATGSPADARITTTRLGNHTVTTVTGGGETPINIHVFLEGELAVVTAAPEDQVTTLLDALP